MDPRVEKMAAVLVNHSLSVRAGDWVIIQTPIPAEPLAEACVRHVLAAGGNPQVIFSSEEIRETMLRHASDDQITFQSTSPLSHLLIEQADVSLNILAPTNTHALQSVDPSRFTLARKASDPLSKTYFRRYQEGKLRWSICAYPTDAAAQDAGMSLREYEDFVYGAGLLDQDDPVAAWQQLADRQQRLVDWLSDKHTVHVTGPGTDLTVQVGGRTWLNDCGHENFPGGEIFTGPHEDGTEGTIEFNLPAFLSGREVTGARLVFEHGVVVDASASADEEYLTQMLDLDEGARRLGEFAFGTNPGIQRFTKNTLFDEKIGGTLHMALGVSIPGTGGVNESALHWDMVYDLRQGSEVTVDNQPFSKDRTFPP